MSKPRNNLGTQNIIKKLCLIRQKWEQLNFESRILILKGDVEGSLKKKKAAQIAEQEWKKLNRHYRRRWLYHRSRDPPVQNLDERSSFIPPLPIHSMTSLSKVFKNPPAKQQRPPTPVQQKPSEQAQVTSNKLFYAFSSRTNRIFCFTFRSKTEDGYPSTAEYLKSRGSYVAKVTKPYTAKSLAEAKTMAPKMLEQA